MQTARGHHRGNTNAVCPPSETTPSRQAGQGPATGGMAQTSATHKPRAKQAPFSGAVSKEHEPPQAGGNGNTSRQTAHQGHPSNRRTACLQRQQHWHFPRGPRNHPN